MKKPTKRTASRVPAVEAPAKGHNVVLPRKSTNPATRKGLAAAGSPPPVQAQVRLDISSASPAVLMALTKRAIDGLTDNVYYPDSKPTLEVLTASLNGQSALASHIENLQNQLKTALLAQEAESVNTREVLKSAARGCESTDSTDQALASAGWELRRTPGPPQALPAPTRLTLKNTAFPGEIIGRWSRVNNFRYYEYQAATPTDPSVAPDWDALPIRSSHAAQATFSDHPVGQLIHLHVRTVGAKGPSPWSDTITGVIL